MPLAQGTEQGRQGSSLVAWWLGFQAFTAVARVQSLVGELRSCKPHGAAKKKRTRGTEAERGSSSGFLVPITWLQTRTTAGTSLRAS